MLNYTIKELPYLDLEQHIDLPGLYNIEKDLLVSFTKSRNYFVEGVGAARNFYQNEFQTGKIGLQEISAINYLKDPNNPFYEYYKELNFNEYDCRFFNRYAVECIQLGQVLELRIPKGGDYFSKHLHDKCFSHPCIGNFSKFMSWVENIKIFDQVGRISFIFNSPHEHHIIHKDSYSGYPDNFVLINLHPERKEFFIIDKNDSEVFVNSKAFVFDTRNYHGTRGLDFYGWTLRLDGIFNREWLRSINMDDYFTEIP